MRIADGAAIRPRLSMTLISAAPASTIANELPICATVVPCREGGGGQTCTLEVCRWRSFRALGVLVRTCAHR